MPDKWLEVSIRATAEAAEALTALFDGVGHGGVVIEPELDPDRPLDEPVAAVGTHAVLRTYLPEGEDLPARRRKIEESVGVLRAFDLAPMGELLFRWIDEADWANAWKQHYQVQRIGRRWVVKPRWQAYAPRPGDLLLELDPGMAFGTGLHPTTQMALEGLEELHAAGEVAGRTLLDLGTGSGILAIGAARLGAAAVLALDVDDVATKAAAENVATNGFAGVVTVQQATVGQPIEGVVIVPGLNPVAEFDGALANIVARVITERAPAIACALRPGAWLVAGGIIADREREAAEALAANGLYTERRRRRGDWVTLQCRKGVAGPTPLAPLPRREGGTRAGE
ncbi:MAG: 50S ribosomal protein L11 methyltransferase [Chloroflexota bacterium]